MAPNEQNLHFAQLRKKVCLNTHAVVLQRGFPSLDSKLKRFVTKKWKNGLPSLSQTDYSKHISGLVKVTVSNPAGCWAYGLNSYC